MVVIDVFVEVVSVLSGFRHREGGRKENLEKTFVRGSKFQQTVPNY